MKALGTLQALVQFREQPDVGLVELEERLALGNLGRVDPDRPGERSDRFVRELHRPAPGRARPPRGTRRRLSLLACLLAQGFFLDHGSPFAWLLFHGLIRLHSGGAPKVARNAR